jgi:hypothetical protein
VSRSYNKIRLISVSNFLVGYRWVLGRVWTLLGGVCVIVLYLGLIVMLQNMFTLVSS